MKTLTVKIPDELASKIDSAARKQKRTRSELVRGALASYLEKPKVSQGISALDVAGKLVGCFEGPEDLSTDGRYLDDYGKRVGFYGLQSIERWRRQ
jgi:Arc/MetJ-type ribon-helix-helix transcriptional regulator